ncbi:ribonuclease BN [Mycobacterium sp. MS1601]|uniref:YihY/virulence factor BrkB family protein n=1 Tax=Mycobacterium sp. MS1601 TaxID=1936029 RepID=UPI00097970A1|nr:YihY/virulence factor BrkB family protein [Mycobacterium sp. MS1601]AQA05555.1 ribonuclease BN [Mycobacterium sp. MS1601]
MVNWLDRLQQRSPAAGFVIAVIYKYVDDQAGYLAALLTYYAFISLFPLLLLLTTVLGVVLAGRPEWREDIYNSALSQFPLIGDQLSEPSRLSGGTAGVVIGIAVALYGGLNVGQALQNAMENIWAVPKNLRPDPIRSRLRSLLLLLVLGTALVATTALVAVGRFLGPLGAVAVVLAALALNTGVLVVAFRVTTTRSLTVRDVLPGALAAAVVWQLLQWFGASYVQHVVASASVTNSVFAVVLGLIAFLYLISTVLLICAEVNVVRVDRLHPRALLTPFTDDVELTAADRKMYEGQAKAQQAKGFQRVEVTFEDRSPAGD